jgi:hypothetical protein
VRTGPLSAEPGITTFYLFCPDGFSPTGGGSASGSSEELALHASYPFDDNMLVPGADSDSIPDNGWATEVLNSGTDTFIAAPYAVCASASTTSQVVAEVSALDTTTQRSAGGAAHVIARP